jgi:FdhE protein
MSGTHVLDAPISIGTEAAPPFVRLPDLGTVFARRAERCRQLAEGHVLEPYLRFIAALAAAQNDALSSLPAGLLPGEDDVSRARDNGLTPLDRLGWRRDRTWTDALRAILARLSSAEMPEPARAAATDLGSRDRAELLAFGHRALSGICDAREAATAFFVRAALQVAWSRTAALMNAEEVARLDPPGLCPMCGSRPVASVVHAAGSLQGVRFLHCELCSTQWHFVRVKCPNCTSTKGIAYQQIEGGGAVKAETCDECGTYTKIERTRCRGSEVWCRA